MSKSILIKGTYRNGASRAFGVRTEKGAFGDLAEVDLHDKQHKEFSGQIKKFKKIEVFVNNYYTPWNGIVVTSQKRMLSVDEYTRIIQAVSKDYDTTTMEQADIQRDIYESIEKILNKKAA